MENDYCEIYIIIIMRFNYLFEFMYLCKIIGFVNLEFTIY